MAGTITVQGTIQVANGNLQFPQVGAQQQIVQNVAGGGIPGQIIVPISALIAVDMSSLTKPGWLWIKNLDPVQCVRFGPEVSSALVKMGYLKPGEAHQFRVDPAATWCLQIDSTTTTGTTAKVQLYIFED